jgi:hypothetical protein
MLESRIVPTALTTLGSLGVNPTDMVGFDISGAGSGGNGVALAVMQLAGESVSKLFRINTISGLSNHAQGLASLVGTVGGGELISTMEIAPPTIQFSQVTYRAGVHQPKFHGGCVAHAQRRDGRQHAIRTVVLGTAHHHGQVVLLIESRITTPP